MTERAPVRWFFYQDAAGLWKWARIDVFGTVLDHAGASFADRSACVDNARRSGFREAPIDSANAVAANLPASVRTVHSTRF